MDRDESRGCRLLNSAIGDELIINDELETLPPSIEGYVSEPLVTLEEACQPLKALVHDLSIYVTMAKENNHCPADGLSEDESAAIYLYTLEWSPWEKCFYVVLNQTLRDPNRSELTMKPWFKYLKLILTALAKLPSLLASDDQRIVYRGVKMKLDDALYTPASLVTWWAFSSCTNSLGLLQSNKFLGTTGERTIFNIETTTGKNISSHSRFGSEDEVLLMPATHMEVVSRFSPAPQLHIIHLREKSLPYAFLNLILLEKMSLNQTYQAAVTTATYPPEIYGNSTAVCHFFGDPHLLIFPSIPGDSRSQYWCQISGRQLLLKNKYVELVVNVTEGFWYIYQFQLSFYGNSGELLCAFSDQQQQCNSSNIIVSIVNNGMWVDIIYINVGMRIQIRLHPITLYFDISIYLSFSLIYVSEGLCISPTENCTLESVGATSRKRQVVRTTEMAISDNAIAVCNLYLNGAINITETLNMTYQPAMVSNLNFSCLHDVMTTNDLTSGTSSINVLLAEGINSLNLTDEQFQTIVNESLPVVNGILQIISIERMQVLPIISPNAAWSNDGILVAGGNSPGNGSNQLDYPCGLFVDDDQTIYIADRLNRRVMAWKPGATSGEIVFDGNNQGNQSYQFHEITDLYLDKTTNNLIICDWANRRVMEWSLTNNTAGAQPILLNIDCYGVTMDDQRFLYVSDIVKNQVVRYQIGQTNGTLIGGGSNQVNPINQLNYSSAIFVDRNYSVYVADTYHDRIVKWDKDAIDGIVVAGGQGRGNNLSQLNHPLGVYVDQLGTVYVSDSYNNRTMRWLKGATQGTVVINGNTSMPLQDRLAYPRGLSFDQYGNCYVVSWGDGRVVRYNISTT